MRSAKRTRASRAGSAAAEAIFGKSKKMNINRTGIIMLTFNAPFIAVPPIVSLAIFPLAQGSVWQGEGLYIVPIA
jgi:hypothetical protein